MMKTQKRSLGLAALLFSLPAGCVDKISFPDGQAGSPGETGGEPSHASGGNSSTGGDASSSGGADSSTGGRGEECAIDPETGECDALGTGGGESSTEDGFSEFVAYEKIPDRELFKLWASDDDLWIASMGEVEPSNGMAACPSGVMKAGSVLLRRSPPDADGVAGIVPVDAPIAHQVAAIHGTDAENVWFVGAYGSVTSFDGANWISHDQALAGLIDSDPCDAFFFSVHTLGPDDTWLAGTSGVFHYDGNTWVRHDVGTNSLMTDVYAATSDDVWVVGAISGLLHYDGDDWTVAPLAGSGGIFGRSGQDIWATAVPGIDYDSLGEVQHFDGTSWRKVPASSPDTQLFYVAGSNAGTYGWEVSAYNSIQVLVELEGISPKYIDRSTRLDEELRDLSVTDDGHVFALTAGAIIQFK